VLTAEGEWAAQFSKNQERIASTAAEGESRPGPRDLLVARFCNSPQGQIPDHNSAFKELLPNQPSYNSPGGLVESISLLG
jgi:hypothetical protein